jgi:hypothetical protein
VDDGHKKLDSRSWEWLSTPKSLGGLGYRDMVLFNQAMLGRQCWRLLPEPLSLCARVLKGRYFPYGDFGMQKNPGPHPTLDEAYCLGGIFFSKAFNGVLVMENILRFLVINGYQV